MLYGAALATEGWGVVASLEIYPPYAGAAVSAITLVIAFGFAVSRPCLTLKVYSAYRFLWYFHVWVLTSWCFCLLLASCIPWRTCLFSYITCWNVHAARWWKMPCIFSARKLLFRRLHVLPQRCVFKWREMKSENFGSFVSSIFYMNNMVFWASFLLLLSQWSESTCWLHIGALHNWIFILASVVFLMFSDYKNVLDWSIEDF